MTGRELDARIALNIFELKVASSEFMNHVSGDKYWYEGVDDKGDFSAKRIPFYSTDIAAAWQVVEKMDCGVMHRMLPKNKHMFWFEDSCSGWQESYPRAVVLAALKCVGVEVD